MNSYQNPFLPSDSLDFENSLKHIKDCGYSMPIFSSVFKNAENITIPPGNYIAEDLRRSRLVGCTVNDSDFTNAIFADSRCVRTDFINIKYKHTNVEYCNFDSCHFVNNIYRPFIGTNFSFSNFSNCEFRGIQISNSTLDSVSFDHSKFEDVTISMSTVENSKFSNCTFKNVELCDLNLCFSEFAQVHMEHVSLPFYQLPYVFGGIDYFLHTNEDVYIGPDTKNGPVLYPDQYKQLLPDIISYFKHYEEYFPIANIYLACGDLLHAYETIRRGIENAARKKDFRMLEFLCKLAADGHIFTNEQLQAIYDRIYDATAFGPMTEFEKKSYFIHLGTIRNLLLFNDSQKTTLELRLQTNIENTDSQKLGLLIGEIEQLFDAIGAGNITYNIEMKHQCPWEIIYTMIGEWPIVMAVLNSINAVFSPLDAVTSFVNNCISLFGQFSSKQKEKRNPSPDSNIIEGFENTSLSLIRTQQDQINEQQKLLNEQQKQLNEVSRYIIEDLQAQLEIKNQLLSKYGIEATLLHHIK